MGVASKEGVMGYLPPPIIMRMFIVCPLGIVMSPGCWPGLQAPTWRPSITESDSEVPANGGSNVACATVRYEVSPDIVITDCDFIVVVPSLQIASPVTLLPLY